MKTIRGVYENGSVRLLEKPPVEVSKKVLITFLEKEEDAEDMLQRNITIEQTTPSMKEYLKDQREDLYQDFIK